MARPRVFLSSTFYDLKQVRAEIERFLKSIGYDAVMHERGGIPYGSKENLEEYCHREIQNVDILISVIGGRFGTHSNHQPYSISQQELKTALELGVPVYIFVETAVLAEYKTYLKNKALTQVEYHYVDDINIYKFIEEVHSLPNNNPVASFASAAEIVDFLRDQWAGLFQRFLRNQGREAEVNLVRDLQVNVQTLNKLITYLAEEKQNSDIVIREIVLSNHPMFSQLRDVLKIEYRVFFTNLGELTSWLKPSCQFLEVDADRWDSKENAEWIKNTKESRTFMLLKIRRDVFDEHGALKLFTAQQWKSGWIKLEERKKPLPPPAPSREFDPGISDDDVPF